MKKLIILLVLTVTALSIIGCGGSSAQPQTNSTNSDAQTQVVGQTGNEEKNNHPQKVLVVYFSRSGNTRELASQIQQIVGGDIIELQPVKAYPTNYNEATTQAKQEIEAGIQPELKAINLNIQDYDTIYVGSPIWWGTVASPVKTFLAQYNLSGKTIMPFVTHGGSGIARSVADIKELCPQATVKDGLAVRSGNEKTAQNEINSWLNRQGVNR